jgi:alpha-L-fucosidase
METYWAVDEGVTSALLELNLGTEKTFNVVMIREPIQLGQRVSAYRFEKWQDGSWEPIIKGTTIGYKRLERLESATTTRRVRLTIQQALAEPLIAEVGLYYDE